MFSNKTQAPFLTPVLEAIVSKDIPMILPAMFQNVIAIVTASVIAFLVAFNNFRTPMSCFSPPPDTRIESLSTLFYPATSESKFSIPNDCERITRMKSFFN